MNTKLLSLTFALVFVPNSLALHGVDPSAPRSSGVPVGFWWEDYDRDGLPDAFTITSDGTARLLRNQGGGTFTDVTRISGLDALSATFSHPGATSIAMALLTFSSGARQARVDCCATRRTELFRT